MSAASLSRTTYPPPTTAAATEHWICQSDPAVCKMIDWVDDYWKSRGRPSRRVMLGELTRLQPWTTLVELGCHAGPMLADIQEAFPKAELRGVEVNKIAAHAGAKYLPTVRFDAVDFMRWLPAQPTKAWDVLVTHYTLAYVAPEDLDAVMSQCLRVARYTLIAEPMVSDQYKARMFFPDFPSWRHDYVTPAKRFGATQIDATPVPEPDYEVNYVLTVTAPV